MMPTEIRLSLVVAGGGAVAFFCLALLRVLTEGGADLLRLPAVIVVLAAATCLGLWLRPRFARVAAIVVLVLVAALYVTVAVGSGPWWARAGSAVLAAGYVYAMVLVNTDPARRYLEAP